MFITPKNEACGFPWYSDILVIYFCFTHGVSTFMSTLGESPFVCWESDKNMWPATNSRVVVEHEEFVSSNKKWFPSFIVYIWASIARYPPPPTPWLWVCIVAPQYPSPPVVWVVVGGGGWWWVVVGGGGGGGRSCICMYMNVYVWCECMFLVFVYDYDMICIWICMCICYYVVLRSYYVVLRSNSTT